MKKIKNTSGFIRKDIEMMIFNSPEFKSATDEIPIKSYFPPKIKKLFKTRNDWIKYGLKPKKDARVYYFHPKDVEKCPSDLLLKYYYFEDMKKSKSRCCGTCKHCDVVKRLCKFYGVQIKNFFYLCSPLNYINKFKTTNEE